MASSQAALRGDTNIEIYRYGEDQVALIITPPNGRE